MRNKNIYTLRTRSTEETKTLAETMGIWLEKGSILSLSGELGSGKTAFVQGLAKGLDVPADYVITSPTYTLINEYPGRLPLYHIDLYRLSDMDGLEDLGFFDILKGDGVVAIEWADKLPELFLNEDIQISIETADETNRVFTIIIYGQKNFDLINHFDLKTNPIYE